MATKQASNATDKAPMTPEEYKVWYRQTQGRPRREKLRAAKKEVEQYCKEKYGFQLREIFTVPTNEPETSN